jgi:hypothetical protein
MKKQTIDLETYLRIKLNEKDAKQLYDIATDDVRGWIDWYNEAEIKSFSPTHNLLTNQNELPKTYINGVEVDSDNSLVTTTVVWTPKTNNL